MKVLTRDLIRKSEENAVNRGDFSFLKLMENAGSSAADLIIENYDIKNKKIAVLCGNGNNGGDGFVIANRLLSNGGDVKVFLPLGSPKTETALHYFSLLPKGIIFNDFSGEFDIIIDAVFGIGLCRELDKNLKSLIAKINKKTAIKIAVDIPSGIACDSGKILGEAFKADLTITFIALKPCFLLPTSSDFCGRVRVCDIGIEPENSDFNTIDTPVLPKRPKNSHKGTFGTALLICGSYGMAGAAILAARAALRSGLGIAKCLMPKSVYPILTVALPEAVCIPSFLKFKKAIAKTDSALIGCGMGNNRHTFKILQRLIKNYNKPIIIDADGINALSRRIDLLKKAKSPIILTPHPAEMARLLKCETKSIEENRIETALSFAKEFNCILVLKGTNTVIASPDGRLFFNTLGNSGMATGGSGDVLAGITVSLSAQGLSPLDAAKTAVYLHSLAADKAAKIKGEAALIPSDIIESL